MVCQCKRDRCLCAAVTQSVLWDMDHALPNMQAGGHEGGWFQRRQIGHHCPPPPRAIPHILQAGGGHQPGRHNGRHESRAGRHAQDRAAGGGLCGPCHAGCTEAGLSGEGGCEGGMGGHGRQHSTLQRRALCPAWRVAPGARGGACAAAAHPAQPKALPSARRWGHAVCCWQALTPSAL